MPLFLLHFVSFIHNIAWIGIQIYSPMSVIQITHLKCKNLWKYPKAMILKLCFLERLYILPLRKYSRLSSPRLASISFLFVCDNHLVKICAVFWGFRGVHLESGSHGNKLRGCAWRLQARLQEAADRRRQTRSLWNWIASHMALSTNHEASSNILNSYWVKNLCPDEIWMRWHAL